MIEAFRKKNKEQRILDYKTKSSFSQKKNGCEL
jgi:hypothetical protein